MEITFKYHKHVDLVFHLLAHFRVNNASDLYSPPYIGAMKKHRNAELFIPLRMEEYYNLHFDRLGMVNFLPFNCEDLEGLVQLLLSYQGFTSADKADFVEPFVGLLRAEAAFYFDYWEKKQDMLTDWRFEAENRIRDRFYFYRRLFDLYGKNALAFFSLSITRNGRGFSVIDGCFSALAPFPKTMNEIDASFYVLLHEYTHQLSDGLLRTNINMADGSHEISEYAVILFDYYLIKAICEADISSYLRWIADMSGHADMVITEKEFLDIFRVASELDSELHSLAEQIAQYH